MSLTRSTRLRPTPFFLPSNAKYASFIVWYLAAMRSFRNSKASSAKHQQIRDRLPWASVFLRARIRGLPKRSKKKGGDSDKSRGSGGTMEAIVVMDK